MEKITIFLALYFLFDRLLKLATVIHFFHRSTPPTPTNYPTISLIQPITNGATNIETNLHSRFHLDYPATIQHILICDILDIESQTICQQFKHSYPSANISILTVEADKGIIASKITKMKAAITIAKSDILCFIDDDIALHPNTMQQMIPYLLQPGVGATFGLACAVSWNTIWSSLMSYFVNSNALISYIPISYFTQPFTITGHLFAITRANFHAAGGWENMENRFDDDHELARRLKAIELKSVQTPVIYKVSNQFFSFAAYANQIKRWFVMPRQAMVQYLSPKDTLISYTLSCGLFIPSLSAILALIFPSSITLFSLLTILLIYLTVYAICSYFYLPESTPLQTIILLPIVAIITPIQIFWALLFANNDITWRGQRWRTQKGGKFQLIE